MMFCQIFKFLIQYQCHYQTNLIKKIKSLNSKLIRLKSIYIHQQALLPPTDSMIEYKF